MLCLGVQYKLINELEASNIKASRLLVAQDHRGLSPVEHYATTHTDVHYLSHHVHGPSAAAVSFGLSERVHVTF